MHNGWYTTTYAYLFEFKFVKEMATEKQQKMCEIKLSKLTSTVFVVSPMPPCDCINQITISAKRWSQRSETHDGGDNSWRQCIVCAHHDIHQVQKLTRFSCFFVCPFICGICVSAVTWDRMGFVMKFNRMEQIKKTNAKLHYLMEVIFVK